MWVWLDALHTGLGGMGVGDGRGDCLASGCRAWVPGSRVETGDTEDKEGLCLWNRECTEPEETASS